MCCRPDLTPAIWVFLVALFCVQGTLAASNGKGDGGFALGSTHSARGVGICADLPGETGAFSSLALTADLIDILNGTASTPGIKATYHYNLIGKEWKDGKYQLYAGPGLTAGRVRDTSNHFGLMAGLSGDAGFRVRCLHSMLVSIEFQADFALQFKNRFNPDMSLYSAGYRHSYLPYIRIQYHF